jgi:tRNA(Ile)-lysidine synthase
MNPNLIDRLLSTISAFEMIDDRDSLLIALSGGADSVALLAAMAEVAPTYNLKLAAAHIHHGLRGAEADRDAAFAERITREIAERYGLDIPFYLHRADVKEIAKEQKLSTQEAGRLVRDTFLRGLMEKTGATKIATGHTGSDNAETLVMRLITGAGPEGLSGIPPVRLPYIRPLIEVTRAEVEDFLSVRAVPWIVDSSNLKNDYLRNRVRNEIMPLLVAVNPAVESSLIEAVAAYRDAFDPLRAAAEAFVAEKAAGGTVPVGDIRALSGGVASEVVKLLIFRAAGPRPTPLRLGRAHIEAVVGLAAGPSHGTKTAKLPGGLVARRVYDTLTIEPPAPRPGRDSGSLPETQLAVPGVTRLPAWGMRVVTEITPVHHEEATTPSPALSGRQTDCAWFDFDTIPGALIARARRPGDRIALAIGSGTAKLSDLFIDEKVPRDRRDRIPLVVFGNDIVWVVGIRADGRFAVTDRTRRVLSVAFTREDG